MARAEQSRDSEPSSGTAATPSSAPQLALQAFVAADPKTQQLIENVRRIAASGSTVLIRGESGTGKELLASLLHYLGPNAHEPLVKIDCASLPHELVESELFGYEPGAFTGATQRKRGRLELAAGGTIVLDEIAALSMPAQAKLLRVIEEKKFMRLGGEQPVPVAARIVALTNIDLEHAVARRSFREDLYYRLNVLPLVVPPLRERRGDIRPLAEQLLRLLSDVHRIPEKKLAPEAMAALEKYAFPGNVRELRNVLERALINGTTAELGLEDLPPSLRSDRQAKMTLEQLERAYIAEVLDYTRGKKSKAAEILGISRKTLLEKRKRYGLD